MRLDTLEKKFKKYKLENLFNAKKYLISGRFLYWKFDNKWYENPFLLFEGDTSKILSINIEEILATDMPEEQKQNIIKMYREIVNEDWKILKENYGSLDLSNKILIGELENVTLYTRLSLLKTKEIKELVNGIDDEITKGKKEGKFRSDLYSVLFNMLESFNCLENTNIVKDYNEIDKLIKNCIYKSIINNPDFFTEDRKFYTYKKVHCDVFKKKIDPDFIEELNEVMGFKPKNKPYLVELKENGLVEIIPNLKYEFLERHNKDYSNFEGTILYIKELFSIINKSEAGNNHIEFVELKECGEQDSYKKIIRLTVKAERPEIMEAVSYKLLELMKKNKNLQRVMRITSIPNKNDQKISINAFDNDLIESVIQQYRTLWLNSTLQNNEVNNGIKTKKKV